MIKTFPRAGLVLAAARLVQLLVTFSEATGATSLAEGVETEEEAKAALLTYHRNYLPIETPFHNSRLSTGESSTFHTDNDQPTFYF